MVDALAEVRLPAVWTGNDGLKRVLETDLKLNEQILLLAAVTPDLTSRQLRQWIEYGNDGYVMRTIRKLHKDRQLEFTEDSDRIRILPPGTKAVEELIRARHLTGIT